MIIHGGLSKNFWAEALCSATYIRNTVITTATGITPYKRWYMVRNRMFQISMFLVALFMLMYHVTFTKHSSRQKSDQKTMKMRFVGYRLTQKGYRLYDENKRKTFIRQDVIFHETEFGRTNEYNWRSKKRMSVLRKNQLRGNHLILDVQREKESQ